MAMQSVSYFISIGEGEELWEVEDDGHEEEGEGVAQPRLRAQAELKAMDRLLKSAIVGCSWIENSPGLCWKLDWWTPPYI